MAIPPRAENSHHGQKVLAADATAASGDAAAVDAAAPGQDAAAAVGHGAAAAGGGAAVNIRNCDGLNKAGGLISSRVKKVLARQILFRTETAFFLPPFYSLKYEGESFPLRPPLLVVVVLGKGIPGFLVGEEREKKK